MRKRILFAGAAAMLLAGCQTSKPTTAAKQPVLETLGNHEVPVSEFAYVYRKNNAATPEAGTRASVQEYLDLYTNFRLKVLEAEARGLDTTQAFQRELEGYKQQLAQPYLTEKSVTDKLVREAYERMSKEINAAHILVRVAPDADPKDTLAAYQKLQALRQRVTSGEDFYKVAAEASEDPSAKENGGRLGYFTAMQMVYPFESAAFKTPAGQVSQPVRTRFGYHIIKVNEVRPAQGEIKVAHLMIRATPNMPAADSVTAKKKIDELYSRLKKGENWEKLVGQFSEDVGSAANGGELPPFSTGRMIPSFEEAAYRLQKPGDLSAPVQTPYGWHVIKLIGKQQLPTFEEMEPTLKSKVAKDSRSELNREAFLKRIRTENQFTENKAALDYAFSKADTSLTNGRFKYVAAAAPAKAQKGKASDETALFTIKGKEYPTKDFLTYVQQNQRARPGADARHTMQLLYDQYVNQTLTDYEKSNLETKYEDYRMLVKEYRDGILLFQLMDEKVWSKAVEDTAGLQKFFTANQANYQWAPRVQATVISAASPQLLTQAQKLLATGQYPVKRLAPASVAFKANSADFTKAGQDALDRLAASLANDTALTVRVTGQIKRGETAALAKRRATRVADYLKSKQVAATQIATTTNAKAAASTALLTVTTSAVTGLEEALNEQNPLAVKVEQRPYQKGDSKVVDALPQQKGTYNTQQDGRYYFVRIEEVLPAGPKSLSDARGQATADYQNYLEKEWIAELRQKYPVSINQTEVDKLITK
ncbi:OmpA family protein [Hymenobacter lutimineralis]|uniref:OmpA family protein n=1 Tax=Hymenobacter lutimineralis TaxID=2606448 RepID=A0A5D6V3L5_9BACT|nr:peptidylprolyl isomerase [Hymenobacter lutimineralis]TYZ09632.1 OmpA family protein [Hymenobacter lutimineralis]